jgi:hypothetical protein
VRPPPRPAGAKGLAPAARCLWRLAGGALLDAPRLDIGSSCSSATRATSAQRRGGRLGVPQIVGALVHRRRAALDREGLRMRPCAASPPAPPCWPVAPSPAPGLLYPLLAVAAISTMSWNGLPSPPRRSPATPGRARRGMQNTLISIGGVQRRPPSACSSRASWTTPTCSRWPLAASPSRPLEGDEDDRIKRVLRARDSRAAPRGGT